MNKFVHLVFLSKSEISVLLKIEIFIMKSSVNNTVLQKETTIH